MKEVLFGDSTSASWWVLCLPVLAAAGVVFVLAKRRLAAKPRDQEPGSVVKQGAGSDPVAERRRSSRRFVAPVFLVVHADDQQVQETDGLVLNVSREGLGLSLQQPVAVGTFLYLRPATAAASAPWVHVEVKHCSAMSNRWKIGCRFVQPLSEEVRLLFG